MMNRVIFVFALLWAVGSSITVEDCPSGLKRDKHLAVFQNKCYYFHLDMKKDFDDAQEVCQQNGGNLASVKTSAINAFVWKKIRLELLYVGQIWIGLSDRQHEGKFTWQDGSPLNYDHFEPFTGPHTIFMDTSSLLEDCVAMNAWDGKWMDLLCYDFLPLTHRHVFVCDYDPKPKPSTTPITFSSKILTTLRSQASTTTATTTTSNTDSSTNPPTGPNTTKITNMTPTRNIATANHSPNNETTAKPSISKETSKFTHIPPFTTPLHTTHHDSNAFTKDTAPSSKTYTSAMTNATSKSESTKDTSNFTPKPLVTNSTMTTHRSSSAFTKDTTSSSKTYTSAMTNATSKYENTKDTSKFTPKPLITNSTMTTHRSSSAFTKDTTTTEGPLHSSSDLPKATTTPFPAKCPPCDLLSLNCGPKGTTIEVVGVCIICKCQS